jgi:hypothetical protein
MWHPWLANIEVRLGLWVRVIHRMVLWTGSYPQVQNYSGDHRLAPRRLDP